MKYVVGLERLEKDRNGVWTSNNYSKYKLSHCLNCSELFFNLQGKQKFCSLDCHYLFHSGEKHFGWKGGISSRTMKCEDCDKEIYHNNKTSRCRGCYEKWNKGENHGNYKDGRSIKFCVGCGITSRGLRCKACFIVTNKGDGNSMFGRRGDKTNHWKNLPEVYCKSCNKDLGRNSNSTVCGDCYNGEYTPRWEGGVSFQPYGIEFNNDLREKIRKRDNYICQECKKSQKEFDQTLSVHHIDYDKKNNVDSNLVTLCVSCHMKTNTRRYFWKGYFYRILEERRSKFHW